MADTDTEPLPNGTGGGALSEEDYERMNQRPADIDADVRAMERGKRVEALMSSKLFREELERVLDQQLHEGGDAPLLQRIREMVGGRLHSGSFRGPSCVLPINDIRGMEGVGYEKGEKILRCKLAAAYRLVDLFGWTQTGNSGQITARLNTAVEQVLTTPRGVLHHEVTASSLVKVDMQGAVVDQGTTNFPVNVDGFSVHAMVHAARPDLKCVLHVRAPAALAVSSMRDGLLPLSTEAALLGDVAYHRVPYGTLDNEEQEKLVRALGPHAKVLVLSNDGALCCGATLEEAFYQARNLTAACDVQLRLASLPLERLSLMDDDTRRQIYESSRKPPADQQKWRAGGEEFEALMRMLDNAGFRTGYVYRHPLIKNDVPRPKNDVEVPPAVSSLGYLLEEEELYRQGLWKKGHGKTGERTRWLNSPNVYQKVEVLETGTNDPKKITKWVDANNEEWVQDGSPQHSSTPVKIDTLQFVPKNTNPKEFKKLQQQIKDNRRADMISAGPQSHILEGVTWDEAAKLTEDAVNTATGDHVVLMGAASKGIIQRGYQHNATVYSAPYARNPFDRVTDSEIADYRRIVERKQRGIDDTDVSDSEAHSGAQFTSPLSETEDESRDEHRVLRIETKQAPVRSQPEIVLSDDFINAERAHSDRTKDAPATAPRTRMTPAVAPAAVSAQNTVGTGNLTNQDLNTNAQALTEALMSNRRSKHDYSRSVNFDNTVKKFNSPGNDSNVTAVKRFSSPDSCSKDDSPSFANFDKAYKKFGTPDNANNSITVNKTTFFETENTNTIVTFGIVTNITENSNFYKVRERFNSPDNINKFTSKSCADIEKIQSPVYENIKKFNSNSCGNVQNETHPKCKISLHARLSGEGNTIVKNVKQTLDKGSQTDAGKDVPNDLKLKSYTNLSGLAKLASEIKNDACNLNSKIAIETLNSKLASEANSRITGDTLKYKIATEANSKMPTSTSKLASEPNSEISQHSKNSQHTKDEELYSYALDLYNPGHNSPRSSLYSIPSIDWDRRLDYTCRSMSLPRQKKTKEQRLYRTQSHSGFVNARIKDPEPTHFHLPRCNSCGATNVTYNWELIKEDLSRCSGRKIPTSVYMPVDDVQKKCVNDGFSKKSTARMFSVPTTVYKSVDNIHQKCQEEATKVTVTANVVPVYKVVTLEEEFVDSQEFNEDNYFGDIGNSFSSNQTVIERIRADDTLKGDQGDMQKSEITEYDIMTTYGALKDNFKNMQNFEKVPEHDIMTTCGDGVFLEGVSENLHRAEYIILDEVEKLAENDTAQGEYLKVSEKDNTLSTEGEYHSFTDEIDFDSAYISPVKDLVEKDIRDYSVPIGLYCDDYKKGSPNKPESYCNDYKEQSPKKPQSPKRPVTPKSPKAYGLEPILEESKSSYGDESSNLSNSDVKRLSGETSLNSDVGKKYGEPQSANASNSEEPESGNLSNNSIQNHFKETYFESNVRSISEELTNDKSSDTKTVINVDLTSISQNRQVTDRQETNNNLEHVFPKNSGTSDRNVHEINNISLHANERETKENNETTISGIETNEDVDAETLATEKNKNAIACDIAKDIIKEIFTTTETAVQLKSELTSSSLKITPELLNSELNRDRDSYLIAEEDDFTTNDIESITTNVVQTAIDVYSEGEEHTDMHETDIDERHDTDIMDCVYDNIFEILSEEAISSKDFNSQNCHTENSQLSNVKVPSAEVTASTAELKHENYSNSLGLNVKVTNIKNHGNMNEDKGALHNDDTYNSNMNIIMKEQEEILPEVEKHDIRIESENDKQNEQSIIVKPSIVNLTESSMICLKEKKFSFDSFASSAFDVRSFDSTAEFENFEAVSEILSSILNKIEQTSSCEIFNIRDRHVITNFEFDKNAMERVDELTADKPLNLKLELPCDLQNTEDGIHQNDIFNVEAGNRLDSVKQVETHMLEPVISFYSQDIHTHINNNETWNQFDAENITHSVIIELPCEMQEDVEYSKTNDTDLDLVQPGETIQPEIEFSIAKIIQDIEHNNLNETVLTEPSESEDQGHKVAEALMYYIFDRVFCSLGEKVKPIKDRKNKKVVTVAESEDILFTALSIWKVEDTNVVKSNMPVDELEILESDNPDEDLHILESKNPSQDPTSDKPSQDIESQVENANLNINSSKIDTEKASDSDVLELENFAAALTHTKPDLTQKAPDFVDTDANSCGILDCNLNNESSISENVEYSLQEDFNTTFHSNSYENDPHETGNFTSSVKPDVNKNSPIDDDNVHEMRNSNKSSDSNESRYLDKSKNSNESRNNNTYNLSDAYSESFDMATDVERSVNDSETSKAENNLNQTFILEKSSDISMNTAFVLESSISFDDRSSSPHKILDVSVFESCSESPIKNSNSFLENSDSVSNNSAVLYEKEDALFGSPFVKRASVISMSQTVNTGGVKYWVSFDDSLTESIETTSYRSIRKSRCEMPSFVSVDFTKVQDDNQDSKKPFTMYEREAKRRNSVLLDDKSFNQSTDTKRTEDSYSYATACLSTDYQTCESDFTDSKTETEPQKKLLYNFSTDMHTRSCRRDYNSWPPYENTLYYKIISKFRMSESFDAVDFENIQIDDRQ